jgi:multiple sugar transport system permease protein
MSATTSSRRGGGQAGAAPTGPLPPFAAGERAPRRRVPRSWFPYLILLPALLVELLVHVVPVLVGVFTSLLKLNQFSVRNWSAAPFVGLDNYAVAVDLSSPIGADLLRSLGTTALYSALVVGLCWVIGLAAAVALHRPFPGRGLLRTLFLVPFALPVFASVITWNFMLQRDTGLVNSLVVDVLGLTDERPFWLVGENSFTSLVVVGVWRTWPFAFLTITAGMQSIPTELYEAANVDGAGPWWRLRMVTLPMLRPVNAVLVLVLFLWSFNDFTTPFTLFGQAAPVEARVISLHVYNSSFQTWNFGLGSAMSVLLVLFLLAAALAYAGFLRWRRDE